MTTAIEINCETGEVVERPLTAEEIAANEAAALQIKADNLAREEADKATLAAKISAQSKLLQLGLSQAEIVALSK
jgi:hypothetical protein